MIVVMRELKLQIINCPASLEMECSSLCHANRSMVCSSDTDFEQVAQTGSVVNTGVRGQFCAA